jgi:hypothetical protein
MMPIAPIRQSASLFSTILRELADLDTELTASLYRVIRGKGGTSRTVQKIHSSSLRKLSPEGAGELLFDLRALVTGAWNETS